ncbi:hypothetical protein [Bradyrhizobium centrolobii]|uniref:hypothetical protein n=1 Tax=Bradyrhizobium centrolobii TaxID=1505087 RepID=UPI0007C48803|nr:hypothetical protein [Bradyrhizobium centrolobii]
MTEIRSVARKHTSAATNFLVVNMHSKKATASVRVAAAIAILDRGWGKPAQPIENGNGPLQMIHRIERVIVHPKAPDGDHVAPLQDLHPKSLGSETADPLIT